MVLEIFVFEYFVGLYRRREVGCFFGTIHLNYVVVRTSHPYCRNLMRIYGRISMVSQLEKGVL